MQSKNELNVWRSGWLLLCILACAQAIACHFACDSPVTECVFVATPRCELLPGCTHSTCGLTASTRVDESTLSQPCPDVETLVETHGDCTGCSPVCEVSLGHWVCDIKVAPICQPVCESPGDVCTGEMIRSYEERPAGTPVAVYSAWVMGAIALVLALLLLYRR